MRYNECTETSYITKYKEFKHFFESLKGHNSYKRLGKTFKTEQNYYFYDMGTGKVLQCEKNVYSILKILTESNNFDSIQYLKINNKELYKALSSIKQAVENENILQAYPLHSFSGAHVGNKLENYIKYDLSQLCLEVTEKCNLRCTYCIYQDMNNKFRKFGNKDMNFDVAKKAIDYALAHANDKRAYFTFYGGEPLLNFNLIKQCVEYIQKFRPKEITYYSLTSNLTLMTKERAEFFSSIPHFSIVCSIDGDKQIHNEHRKTILGEGSFDQTMHGLKNLKLAYKEKARDSLLINSVICPPFNNQKFDRMQNFFHTYLPNIRVMYNYVEYGQVKNKKEIENISNELKSKNIKELSPLITWAENKYKTIENNNKNFKDLFTYYSLTNKLVKIHKRPLFSKPIPRYKFNGCCIPGSRRLFVSTIGNYKICERIGHSPIIGNVDSGVDINIIKKYYIQDYMKKSIPDCGNCWAVYLCGICYAQCFEKNGIDIDIKKLECRYERLNLERTLCDYHQLLENDPNSLKYLNDITID